MNRCEYCKKRIWFSKDRIHEICSIYRQMDIYIKILEIQAKRLKISSDSRWYDTMEDLK